MERFDKSLAQAAGYMWVFIYVFSAGWVTQLVASGFGLTGWLVNALGMAAAAVVGVAYIWPARKVHKEAREPPTS